MAINHSQKLARLLFKLAEDPNATVQQRLDAMAQLNDLLARSGNTIPKRKRYPKRAKAGDTVSSLLG